MANTSVGYKCPNCGGPLAFAPGSEKVTCPYCDTEFEVAKIEELFAKQEKLAAEVQAAKEAKWDTADAGSEWGEDEAAQMQTFTCSSCGAGQRWQYDDDGMLLLRQPDHDSQPFFGDAQAGFRHPL